MEWIEVRISTTSEGIEPVFGVLLSCGVSGARIIDDKEMIRFLNEHPLTWDYLDEKMLDHSSAAFVVFYVTPGPEGRETLTLVKKSLEMLKEAALEFDLGTLNVSGETVDDESWLHEWKKYYKTFRIGQSVVIKPVWENYEPLPGDTVFTLDPGSVFGTGLHQTTQLCVEALEKYAHAGQRMLDIGCGSGILSVIGLLLGVEHALACDLDPAAAVAAKENVLLNPVDPSRYLVLTGDIFSDEHVQLAVAEQPCDLVVANIVADVIIRLASIIQNYLKPKGVFISSGIIAERLAEVKEAFEANGLSLMDTWEKDGWCCVVSCRKEDA